jgi:hypothetical protein
MLRNRHYKRIFGSPEKLKNFKELDVFRMAFKRSGVRLPLAPPNIRLAPEIESIPPNARGSMIFSENRCPLFGIIL